MSMRILLHRHASSPLCMRVTIPAMLKNITYISGYVLCSKYFGVKLKLVYFNNCKIYEFIRWISLLQTT
jgi:hypothetical protein